MIAELVVDWLKHAFITKFNEINSEVYKGTRTTSLQAIFDFSVVGFFRLHHHAGI